MPPFQEPSHWTHHLPEVSPGVKIHYVEVTPNEPSGRTIVLIHGFPQTWYEFRHIMQPLADQGLRVVAVDYRGAGASSRPQGGYDKLTMARDIRDLYVEHLGVERAIVFGHDIGSMVAVNLALQFPDNVEKLVAAGQSS
jgi:pimeloyl-ACP methyl ester carboxylesterase